MFEELRGLPPKPEKTYTKKQKGCFKFGFGFLFVLVALIIGMIFVFRGCDGNVLRQYQQLADALKIEVDESEIAPNKIVENDFINFENLINTNVTNKNGLDLFNENHEMILENLMAEDLVFHNNITLNEKMFACFCSDVLEANLVRLFDATINKEALSVIEIDINTTANKTFIKGVLKIIPEKMFENYAQYKEKYGFASTFFAISSFTFDNMTNEIESANLQINKLSSEQNNLLLKILAGSKSVEEFCKMPAKALLDGLDEFKEKYNALLNFEEHAITAILV